MKEPKTNYKYPLELANIPKKMRSFSDLLIHVGAASLSNGTTFPNHVYIHPKDAKRIKAQIKKDHTVRSPWRSPLRIDGDIGMDWLNYGPTESNAVPEGKVIVNRTGIKLELERLKNTE